MDLILSIKREKLFEYYSKKGYINQGEDNNILYVKIYNEILVFLGKIKEIKVNQKETIWYYNEEGDEYIVKIGFETTFSNPLNAMTDINRNYSMFKIILEIKKSK